jgi:hypothetical protein
MENKDNIIRGTYSSLEEIQSRKDELKENIQQQTGHISTLWRDLTAPQPSSSKGELIAHLVTNSVTAIDGFLLVRKLIRGYGYIFGRKKHK